MLHARLWAAVTRPWPKTLMEVSAQTVSPVDQGCPLLVGRASGEAWRLGGPLPPVSHSSASQDCRTQIWVVVYGRWWGGSGRGNRVSLTHVEIAADIQIRPVGRSLPQEGQEPTNLGETLQGRPSFEDSTDFNLVSLLFCFSISF